ALRPRTWQLVLVENPKAHWPSPYLQLDTAIQEPPQRVVLLPGRRPRRQRSATRLGVVPALLVSRCCGCVSLVDGAEPRAPWLRMTELTEEFVARAATESPVLHHFRHVDVGVERIELCQPSRVRVRWHIHAHHVDGVRWLV